MQKLISIVPLLALLATGTASGSTYITFEGTSVSLEEQTYGDRNPTGMRFRLGTPVGRNLDIEAHLGGGTDFETEEFDEFRTTYFGVFLKGYLPVGTNSALYALGGMSNVRFSQTLSGTEFFDDQQGLSFGAGIETRLSKRLDLTADYVRYTRRTEDSDELSALSFGIKFYF